MARCAAPNVESLLQFSKQPVQITTFGPPRGHPGVCKAYCKDIHIAFSHGDHTSFEKEGVRMNYSIIIAMFGTGQPRARAAGAGRAHRGGGAARRRLVLTATLQQILKPGLPRRASASMRRCRAPAAGPDGHPAAICRQLQPRCRAPATGSDGHPAAGLAAGLRP